MSIICGFFNSKDGDRKYNAVDFGKIFTGLINDGIFASVGSCFTVTSNNDNTVKVGTGKAWFNNTWTENDDDMILDCGTVSTAFNRYDVIVIKVDNSVSVRRNDIIVINGSEAKTPVIPDVTASNSEYVHYYPIAYVYRRAGSTSISQSDIRNAVGVETPFVTGIVDVLDLKTILKQWESQLDDYIQNSNDELSSFTDSKTNEFNAWYAEMKQSMATFEAELDTWTAARQATFDTWFNGVKNTMSGDAATNITLRLDATDVERYLTDGFAACEKTFSDDGSIITSTNPNGLILVKEFTNSFRTCTVTLKNSENVILGTLIKNFSSDGKMVSSTMTNLYTVSE